jgi:hypothetical protein
MTNAPALSIQEVSRRSGLTEPTLRRGWKNPRSQAEDLSRAPLAKRQRRAAAQRHAWPAGRRLSIMVDVFRLST